jgi:6-phosphogluconolactonase
MIHSFSTIELLAHEAKNQILSAARQSVAERGVFHWVLSGGSTPKLIFPALAADTAFRQLAPSIHIWWGDERSVAHSHPDSNVLMAREFLLHNLPIPNEQIHAPNGGAHDLPAEARRYEVEIRSFVPTNTEAIPVFDFVMLGMGTDGHTASLFPGTEALQIHDRLFVENNVPQLQTQRLTLTYPILNAARFLQIIATGESKAGVISEIFNSKPRRYPIELLQGSVHWLCDEAALSQVHPRG